MQNVTLAGMTLQDYSVSEATSIANRLMRNSALDIISYIDYRVLMNSLRNDGVKEFISSSAVLQWTDADVLETVGVTDKQRNAEVSGRKFLLSLLENLAAGHKEIALAGPNEAAIEQLRKELLDIVPGLNLIHDAVLDLTEDTIPEGVINGINEHSPMLVISRMEFEDQQKWLSKARSMINVGIWLAIPTGMSLSAKEEKRIWNFVRRKICLFIFRRRAGKIDGGKT